MNLKPEDILKLKSELGDFIEIVHEPDYSRSMLKQLQDKYSIKTEDFIDHEELFPQITKEDARDWKFYYYIYLNSNSDDKLENCERK